MEKWIDYYKVLQVHEQAEAEVIESAYKRLCRKYHPDVNRSRNAIEKIIQLNIAYEILKDERKRRVYHENWLKRNDLAGLEHGADSNRLSVLEDYFRYISDADFKKAYLLISDHDKTRISEDDFIRWQRAVSKVFHIVSFECVSMKQFRNVMIGDATFVEVIECCYKMTEKNLKNRSTMVDEVTKYIVREKEAWNVFVGVSQLQPLIDKFEHMAKSQVFPTAMDYWAYMQIRTDHLTGLPNKDGLMEKARMELSRCMRYGNKLSVLFLKLKWLQESFVHGYEDYMETAHRMYASSICRKIRDTDMIGVWEPGEFVILLPETDYHAAREVAGKLGFKEKYEDVPEEYKACVCVGVAKYEKGSLLRVISEARIKAMAGCHRSDG